MARTWMPWTTSGVTGPWMPWARMTTMHVFTVLPAVEASVDVDHVKARTAVDEICATVHGLNHVPAVPTVQHVLTFLTKDMVGATECAYRVRLIGPSEVIGPVGARYDFGLCHRGERQHSQHHRHQEQCCS